METIACKIFSALKASAGAETIGDIRMGLGYSAVRLISGEIGLCWTPKEESRCCHQFPEAGTLTGRPAADLLDGIAHPDSALKRMLGVATANALCLSQPPVSSLGGDVLSVLELKSTDHLVMVGHFGPLLPEIRRSGCRLDVVETCPADGELDREQGLLALKKCTVAIITATTLVTGGLDGYLAALGSVRAAVLLGPSVPLFPDVFRGTGLTHLAGSRVRDGERILRIVSEGGGTPMLKPCLEAVVVRVLRG
ncbi:MAG TPA: DUF364 domain-containing protein [Candidatus Ozemobacteraceae bacterium]|nr:DUF364 domain-containing protein [Candidatus Ozemobacteraceae bacterium]